MLGKNRMFWRRNIEGYLFISPWIIGFVVFTAGALLGSFSISLTKWNVVGTPEIVGLANYQKMVEDRFFWQSIKVTLYYLLNVPLNVVLGLLLALLLNQKVKGLSVFRTIFFLPSVASGVAVSLLWMWIFNPRFGIINVLLKKIGIIGPLWLGSEAWAIPALIIMSIWGVGGGMLIYLGALQGIPTAFYEAATLDGAGAWKKLLHITVPMITPVLLLNLVMGVIVSFQVFTQAYVMTDGGPNYATLFYVMYLYQQAFVWFNMGYASALSWVLFLIILVFTVIILKTSSSWVYYESD
ncbi:MAG: sugar ABC transporter permease [Gemmatimonadetes bacterium]|nr:sugar ABC transporter permease [Gemmatimonadota bacterium]MDE0143152.1 sugar ABC transporter permease [Caldilineaceae bacterium]MDE0292545.1 sugar ABC transporter permease [Candidatus Dadabacteria bacterium]MXZ19971.1 sugar ABC transporter permease [Caldilineaceae bacterium SB0665_bin_25]